MQQKEKLYKAKKEICTPLFLGNGKRHVLKAGDLVTVTDAGNYSVSIDCGPYGKFNIPRHQLDELFKLVNEESKNKIKIDLDDILKSVYKEVAETLDIPETELVCTEPLKTPFGLIKKGTKAILKNNVLKIDFVGEWIVIKYKDVFELLKDITLHFTAAKKEETKKDFAAWADKEIKDFFNSKKEVEFKCSPIPGVVNGKAEIEEIFNNRMKMCEPFGRNMYDEFHKNYLKQMADKKNAEPKNEEPKKSKDKKLFLNCIIKNGGIVEVNPEAFYSFHKAKRRAAEMEKELDFSNKIKPCLLTIAEPDPQQRLFNFLHDEFGIIALHDELSAISTYLKNREYE